MSHLPQRKKTAEEIAKLRENLGVPTLQDAESEKPVAAAPDTLVPEPHEASIVHHPAEPAPDTLVSNHHESIVVHHAAPPETAPEVSENPADAPDEEPETVSAPVPHLPKPVRSLKKSEQVPVLTPAPAKSAANSKLPTKRHSDKELAEIRRRDTMEMTTTPPQPNPKLAAAHPALIIPGYLFAVAGATCFVSYDFPMAATASCTAAALLIAGFIFLRKPISRHHAGFIAMIALFVLIFGTLHFFPHLRHAT